MFESLMIHAKRNSDIEVVQTTPMKREMYILRKWESVIVSGDAGATRRSRRGTQME